jgi:predicted dehydrogenase
MYRTGGNGLSLEAIQATRLPAGHPEGYLEAFANLYKDFASACRKRSSGENVSIDFPTVEDGLRGMKFIDAVVESSAQNAAWVKL